MIVGLGVDITELDRIERSYARFGARFIEKVLTPAEAAAMPEFAVPFIAARFAAKEAGAKALGTGFKLGVTLQSFEVLPEPSGKPQLRLLGAARELADGMGVKSVHVSLSHGRDAAVAVVILEA